MTDPSRPGSAYSWIFSLFSGLLLMSGPVAASDPVTALLAELRNAAPTLDAEVLQLALEASDCAEDRNLGDNSILTVIDYSLPSTEPRLWVLDLDQPTHGSSQWKRAAPMPDCVISLGP